jgi:nucleotide-binding universal stress UspA family protein
MIIQHVLVPIDFSATADRALTYAIALEQQLQARLTLLHVLDMTPVTKDEMTPGVAAPYLDTLATEAQRLLQASLERVQADLPVEATQDNVVELEEGGSMAQREQVDAIRHCLIDKGIASQHVVVHGIGHRVATRLQEFVNLRELALHIAQGLLDGFQVQTVCIHDPCRRP